MAMKIFFAPLSYALELRPQQQSERTAEAAAERQQLAGQRRVQRYWLAAAAGWIFDQNVGYNQPLIKILPIEPRLILRNELIRTGKES